MKKLFLLSNLMILTLVVHAQEIDEPPLNDKSHFVTKAHTLLQNFSFTATGGTPSFSMDGLKTSSIQEFGQISVADLNLSYRINSRFSVGVSLMNALGNCNSGYYTEGDQFVAFVTDEDDDHHQDEWEDDDDAEDEDECECGDDELGNVMGTVTFKFPEGIPLFIQAAGGYSLNYHAPAFSAMAGYYHQIISGLGVVGGIRFSDILHQLPPDGVRLAPTSGIKAEIGLSWNF